MLVRKDKERDNMKKLQLDIMRAVFEECNYPYHELNALEKVSAEETGLLRILENIPSEVKKDWEGIDTSMYDRAVSKDKNFCHLLKLVVAEAVSPYFDKAVKCFNTREWTDLMEMGFMPNLAITMKELCVRVFELREIKPGMKHKVRMNRQLLDIIEALVNRVTMYWRHWKYVVEEIANNLPLDEILDTVHSCAIYNMDEVIKAILPDIITSLLFYVNCQDLFLFRTIERSEGIERKMYSDKILDKILDTMGKRYLYKQTEPLEEQLITVYTEIMCIYLGVEDKKIH